jgi:hypothetical protein
MRLPSSLSLPAKRFLDRRRYRPLVARGRSLPSWRRSACQWRTPRHCSSARRSICCCGEVEERPRRCCGVPAPRLAPPSRRCSRLDSEVSSFRFAFRYGPEYYSGSCPPKYSVDYSCQETAANPTHDAHALTTRLRSISKCGFLISPGRVEGFRRVSARILSRVRKSLTVCEPDRGGYSWATFCDPDGQGPATSPQSHSVPPNQPFAYRRGPKAPLPRS